MFNCVYFNDTLIMCKLNHIQLSAELVGSELCKLSQNTQMKLETVARITQLHIKKKNQNNSDKQERKEGRREGGRERRRREVISFSCKIRERQPRTGKVTPGDIQAPVFHSSTLPVISMLNVAS